MIAGSVPFGHEGIIEVSLRGPAATMSIAAVVDTGFISYFALREETIRLLGLPHNGVQQFVLADGSSVYLHTYSLEIKWDGAQRKIPVQCIEDTPLIGMAMMNGYTLSMEISKDGNLTLAPRRPQPPPSS